MRNNARRSLDSWGWKIGLAGLLPRKRITTEAGEKEVYAYFTSVDDNELLSARHVCEGLDILESIAVLIPAGSSNERVSDLIARFVFDAEKAVKEHYAIQAHLRQACEHKNALHVDAAIDVVDTDPVEADAWAYEAGKEAWEFDLQAPEKLASHPALSAAFKRGFLKELRAIPTLAELATEVSNSEASDGCEAGYTVVHAGYLRALLNKIRLGTNAEHAALFLKELLDSVETLTGIAEEHGPRTLADLVYLQAAILNDGFIDHYPGESRVPELVQRLPSGRLWMQYIKTE